MMSMYLSIGSVPKYVVLVQGRTAINRYVHIKYLSLCSSKPDRV